jgi:hypothetical protein
MASYQTSDGTTTVNVTGPLDPAVPLVVLLHGVSGDEMHMTDPLNGMEVGGVMFDNSAAVAGLRDEGWHLFPALVPIAGFDIDPVLTSVTSWSGALNGAGFPTLSYSQVQPRGPLGPNLAQLIAIAGDILANPAHPELAGMRLAFVAHSRGGILLRQFLLGAAVNTAFMSRVVAAITLHSPHTGSGLANAAVAVDGQVASIQATLAAAGVTPSFLGWIRSQVNSAAYPEIAVDSPTLATLAAVEPQAPVPGPEWHTFGGTSTRFTRLRAHLFTIDSTVPFFPPFFHWTTLALEIGEPIDAASFAPLPVPILAELQVALLVLAAITPELAPGSGDALTADARTRLPFALSHTSNPLNHAEALYDPRLQAQVLAILRRFRTTPPPPPAPPVEVPDVRERRRDAAVQQLTAVGLVVRLTGSPSAAAWVAGETPAAGTLVAPGSEVTLLLRTGPIP